MYRMIALDIDGTLLNDDYQITEAAKKAIQRAHEQGAEIVLCTGRSPENAVPILSELGLEGVLITHNGAVTVQTPGPQLIHQFSFPAAWVEPLVKYCRDRNVHFDVCTAFQLHAERVGEAEASMYTKYLISPVRTEDVLSLQEPIVKLTASGSEAEMDRVEKEWLAAGLPHGLQMLRSGIQFIDVMLPEVSKGAALQQLAESRSIRQELILAMGNYYNDIDMLQYAGLGVAMGNSPEAVKQAANLVAPTNNEEGVARILNNHCLS